MLLLIDVKEDVVYFGWLLCEGRNELCCFHFCLGFPDTQSGDSVQPRCLGIQIL